jgi:hypothetical protein
VISALIKLGKLKLLNSSMVRESSSSQVKYISYNFIYSRTEHPYRNKTKSGSSEKSTSFKLRVLSDGNPNPMEEKEKPLTEKWRRSRLTRVLQVKMAIGNLAVGNMGTMPSSMSE